MSNSRERIAFRVNELTNSRNELQFERTSCPIRGNELQFERTSCPIRRIELLICGNELLIPETGLHNSIKRFTYGFFLNPHVSSGLSYIYNPQPKYSFRKSLPHTLGVFCIILYDNFDLCDLTVYR